MEKSRIAFYVILGVALGVLSTVVIKKISSFSIATELDPVAIASMLVTIIFGLYLSIILSRREKNDDAKKNQYVNVVESFERNIVEEFSDILSIGEKDAATINRTFKYIRRSTSNLSEYIKSKMEDESIIEKIDSIKSKTTSIWEIATDSYVYNEEIIYKLKIEMMDLEYKINDLIIDLKIS